ncbi:enoyl-CoA hydratase [Parvularcula sp. IMCC14364]|uniref:enoyl-CoA hydratase n=1 Tax=Parvularcula sp. IMCC14364 TaxID=3067902 RepID=UPI002740DD4F|nr:enoyl-CoA hydratase [Parvularcula sp. IMCC14364]
MTDKIVVHEDRGILRVRINHPEKKNSLLPEMYVALCDAFRRAEETKSVRVLLLEGEGDMFTAGNDMSSFLAIKDADKNQENPSMTLMKLAALAQKPVVAAVNGPAVGIGITLLSSVDLVYAAEEARFLAPFVNLGIVPEAGTTMLMPQFLGWQAAAEILLTGDWISAERACEMGLVNRVVPLADLEETAMAACLNIASKPPESVRLTKQMMRGDTSALMARIEYEMTVLAQCAESDEMKEAVMAFLEKRKPDFSKFG